jgi:hypothetical protein
MSLQCSANFCSVSIMMLGMMDFHRTRIYMWFQCIVIVWKIR